MSIQGPTCCLGDSLPGHADDDRHPTPRRLGFVLIPGFSLLTLSSAMDAFRLANERSQVPIFSYKTVSIRGKSVASNDGITITVDADISNCEELDIIFIISSLNVVEFHDRDLVQWLRSNARSGVMIAPLGSATVLAARAGILDGYRCSTHWQLYDQFLERFPKVDLTRDLYCIDRRRLTCAGGLSALDLGLTIVSQMVEGDVASEVAEIAVLTRIRSPADSQRMAVPWRYGVHDKRIEHSIILMERNIENPLPLQEIATSVGLSVRQLERLFRKSMQRSPLSIYRQIRLKHSRELLIHSAERITTIAVRCGFADSAHFGRQFKAHFGETPAEVRARYLNISSARASVIRTDAV
jgi:transcriptional regulator GlxA family with amidase domain